MFAYAVQADILGRALGEVLRYRGRHIEKGVLSISLALRCAGRPTDKGINLSFQYVGRHLGKGINLS